MQDAYFLFCYLIIYVIKKLRMEGLSKGLGDIKHNELLMLKCLISYFILFSFFRPDATTFSKCLFFCLRLIFLLSHITKTPRCWESQSRIKKIPAYWKRIFPQTSLIFVILSLETISSAPL